MKNKTSITTAIIVVSLAIGISAYAHGPGGGSRGSYGMGGSNYGMMGGHGNMGGYGTGHGMMDGNGTGQGMMNGYNNRDQNRYDLDTVDQYGRNPRDYGQDNTNSKSEKEALINQIEERRRELDPLLRSSNADKAPIDSKVEELNNLERYLDEKISFGN
jgi:hypothetical protein